MVSGGGSLHIPLCVVPVWTGSASLVAECGTNICFKNAENHFFKIPFLGHFNKSVTGSESKCRSIMASSSQKWS